MVLISSYVLSRLDYCNSLLVGLPDESFKKLQRIQNQSARLVLKRKKRDHITPMLIKLYWLPVRLRVQYKIAVICYNCMNQTSPKYLSDLIQCHSPSRALRSSDQKLLKVFVTAKPISMETGHFHSVPRRFRMIFHFQ